MGQGRIKTKLGLMLQPSKLAYFVKGNTNQDHYKTMNGPGPVEKVFFLAQRSSCSCAMVLHVMKEGKLPSCQHEIETLPWPWGILKPEMKKKTIANKQNLIDELISVWARND